MAGLISKTACNLSDANAFWRIEAANPGTFNSTTFVLSTNRNISVTFANAGNCQGVALCLTPNGTGFTSTSMKDVRVTLQQIMGAVTTNAATEEVTFASHGFSDGQEVEFSATGGGITVNVKYFARVTGTSAPTNTFNLYDTSAHAIAGGATGLLNITGSVTPTLYAIRADKTLTGDQIVGGSTTDSRCTGGYWKDFTFASSFAVDTTSSKWRFNVIQGSGTNDWALRSSDGTAANVGYVTWCDNQLSFTSGSDWVFFKDIVTVTASASLTGSGNTGVNESTVSVCGIIGVGTGGVTASTVSNLLIPASSGTLTLTLNGYLIHGGRGGTLIGSSGSRYAAANPLTISLSLASSGTDVNSGFRDATRAVGSETGQKESVMLYGEYPAVEDAILAADVATGAGSVTTTVATNWVSGDKFYMGGINTAGFGTDVTEFTVSSTSGTTVNFTPNTATNTRKAGGRLVRSNGYGIIINGASSSKKAVMKLSGSSNLIFSGVRMKDVALQVAGATDNYSYDDSANCSTTTFEHCFYECTSGTNRAFMSELTVQPSDKGFVVDNCNVVKGTFIGVVNSVADIANVTKTLSYTNNITFSSNFYSNASGFTATHPGFTITGNVVENSSLGNLTINSANCVASNNVFWRSQNSTGAFNLNAATNLSGGGNTYNGCVLAIYLQNTIVNTVLVDEVFGNILANTTDIDMATGSFIDFELNSPTGNANLSTTNLALITNGSSIRITDNNDTANDDKGWTPYGRWQRTGYLLADTLVWNGTSFTAASAGQFAFRAQPTSGVNAFNYQDNGGSTTIGNCQNLPVVVTARIIINNAAYYAGTHINPTLRVTYDGTTVATTSVATNSTSAQQLQVNFTPTTVIENIKIELFMASDASGSNAYVYLGELLDITAGGVSIDTTRMGKWAHALPLGTLRTFQNNESVWSALRSNFNVDGTFGQSNQIIRSGTAQAGASGSITLDASASSVTDFYKFTIIRINSGTGAGQSRFVSAYNGTTKVATIYSNWATNPDNTSVFCILPFGSVEHAVWDALTSNHQVSGSEGEAITRIDVNASDIPTLI